MQVYSEVDYDNMIKYIILKYYYFILQAIEKKSLKMNLKGIGIGGGWVDPKESVLMQPEFLYLSVSIFHTQRK